MEDSLVLVPSEVFCLGWGPWIFYFWWRHICKVAFHLASLKQQRKNNMDTLLSHLSLFTLYFSLFSKSGRIKKKEKHFYMPLWNCFIFCSWFWQSFFFFWMESMLRTVSYLFISVSLVLCSNFQLLKLNCQETLFPFLLTHS